MSDMLPVEPAHARSLTAVLPTVFGSVRRGSRPNGLPPARSAVVLVVDGLGVHNLTARAGHARFLVGARARKDVAVSVFPTTTAVALTSLTTGTDAGQHGIVGYRVRVPESGVVAGQLSGWEEAGLDPATWQRSPTLWEQRPETPGFVVSTGAYEGSGFTRAALRGAAFIGVDDLEERLQVAADTARSNEGAVVYAYVPDLDQAGHKHGWESDAWLSALERVDSAVRRVAGELDESVGMLVTADHGMIDVPSHGHILLGAGDALLEDVAAVAGEPRMLHLYAAEGGADALARRWRASEGERSWVLTREEASARGLFGAVHPDVAARVGDVLVAARGAYAYYDDRVADKAAQRMIGQHGSLTAQERIVPLIRLGAYAR